MQHSGLYGSGDRLPGQALMCENYEKEGEWEGGKKRGQRKLINRNEREKKLHSFPTSAPSQSSKVSMEMNWLNL